MANVRPEHETFRPRPPGEWRHLLGRDFGIFQGERSRRVRLRFAAARAPWIREQHFHPDQVLEELADGGLVLSLPVADLREIRLLVLQFGAEVEVLEPAELRRWIEEEICRMAGLYRLTPAKEESSPGCGR